MLQVKVHLFRAAFCLAFFGFLRVGELTFKSLKGHDSRPLQDGDIEIAYGDGSRMVTLTIRQSKTDQFGLKTTSYLSETGDLACTVSSVSNFRTVCTQVVSNSRHYLVYYDGYPLTRRTSK